MVHEPEKMEELQRLVDTESRREPFSAVSEALDLGQYLFDYWIEYFPHPRLDAYLEKF